LLRFSDVQSRPTAFLEVTSLTLEEFQILISPFETVWCLKGKPRTARQFTAHPALA